MSRNAKMYIYFKDSVTWSEQKKFHSLNIFSPFLFTLFTIETFAVFFFLYFFIKACDFLVLMKIEWTKFSSVALGITHIILIHNIKLTGAMA